MLKGVFAAVLLLLNSLLWVPLLLLIACVKLLLPVPAVRRFLSHGLIFCAESWAWFNDRAHRLIHGRKVLIDALPPLRRDDWYLVISNHQSMVDIPVLQSVFNRRIPFLKFFIKRQLLWVPLFGLAWWALDYPFMRRYSKEFLRKNPHLAGRDLEQTRKSCEKFMHTPTSVMNFAEGSRFTPAKHQAQQSKYRHLLMPKAGGIGFVLGTLGQRIEHVLLVSLCYLPKVPGIWDFLCGRFQHVRVRVQKIRIPDALKNKNYITDEHFRADLFEWIDQLWHSQDQTLHEMKNG